MKAKNCVTKCLLVPTHSSCTQTTYLRKAKASPHMQIIQAKASSLYMHANASPAGNVFMTDG